MDTASALPHRAPPKTAPSPTLEAHFEWVTQKVCRFQRAFQIRAVNLNLVPDRPSALFVKKQLTQLSRPSEIAPSFSAQSGRLNWSLFLDHVGLEFPAFDAHAGRVADKRCHQHQWDVEAEEGPEASMHGLRFPQGINNRHKINILNDAPLQHLEHDAPPARTERRKVPAAMLRPTVPS